MVKLNKIYTRTGDDGETSLVNGRRVAKHSRRPTAFGEVDEANSVIGLARLHTSDAADEMLGRIQNDLFDLGADISRPGDDADDGNLRIQPSHVARLEAEIDVANEALQPLASFVLRGGSPAAANLHFACTIVRRAERSFAALAAAEPVNKQTGIYLNRLSDLLFVLARRANDDGATDILWQPGLTI